MSALTPIPQDCVTQGDITPAMRQWMGNVLGDAVGFDNAISYIESTRNPQNIIVDGECQIAQAGFGSPIALTVAPQFGPVDMWAIWASGGVPVAGILKQETAAAGTSTQFAAAVAGLTLTGAGQVSYRQRIESKMSRELVNQSASFSCAVRHGNPAAVPVVVVVRVANAVDNFGATTTIYTSTAQSAAPGAVTTIGVPNIAMGNCANGIEVEIQMQMGACAGSFTQLADAQLVRGAIVPTFLPIPFDVGLLRVNRYYQKSFPYATIPATNTGSYNSALTRHCIVAGVTNAFAFMPFPTRMRAQPSMSFYNPKGANGNWYNITRSADSGMAGLLTDGWGEAGLTVWQPQVAADAIADLCAIHWTADARL